MMKVERKHVLHLNLSVVLILMKAELFDKSEAGWIIFLLILFIEPSA